MKKGVNGASKTTKDGILFGAGTYHKNLKYSEGKWNFEESCIGATSGGGKLSIVPEYLDIEVDGIHVPVKELKRKIGEKATLETNPLEVTADLLKESIQAQLGTSDDKNFSVIESKENLEDGDFNNIAFVGQLTNGKNVIAILDNALCTSGLELEGKDKSGSAVGQTYECHASLDDVESNTLPWHIYYPADESKEKASEVTTESED